MSDGVELEVRLVMRLLMGETVQHMCEAFLFIATFSFQIEYYSERGDERTLNQESHTYSSTFIDTKTIQKNNNPPQRKDELRFKKISKVNTAPINDLMILEKNY